MSTKNRPRGLESIRSISGLVTEATHPHRKFLKLAILAMEEARRGKEKASAQARIDNIDERLVEIRAESGALLDVCNEIINVATDTASQNDTKQTKRGFTLRY